MKDARVLRAMRAYETTNFEPLPAMAYE